eukprot:gene4681-8253_t
MKISVETEDPDLPARAGHTMYCYDDSLFLFFGYDFALDGPTNSIHRQKNGKWSKLKTRGIKPSESYGHTMCEKSYGKLIFYGGINQESYINKITEFDCQNMMWKNIESKNLSFHEKGIYEHSAVLKNDKMYIYGGYPLSMNCIYEFNFSSFEWNIIEESKTNPPQAIIGSSMIYFENSLIVFGGKMADSRQTNELFDFNLKKKKWKCIKTTHSPSPRKYHRSFLYQNCMLIFGGSDSKGNYCNELYRLNLINNFWELLSRDLTSRSYHSICQKSPTKFHISGGENSTSYTLEDFISIEFHDETTIFNQKKKIFSFELLYKFKI